MSSRVLEGARRVTAILGPTNTGKTHRAIQAMLQHRSGMIGLPLRLLAREVYDRVVAERGPDAVALVTGEEKIVPPEARYFVCTVEAMPVDRPVAFLAVDEIQLAGDRQRGHVFTDRLLRARGVVETLFMGSDTIAPLLEELVPDVRIERRPRFSELRYAGCTKLGGVGRRAAVVAFSADQVYAHAERLRALHGGSAVVLGALSPRTRNAQVEMFQSGEVQHLVATDAIGMGLNLDVRHVAFAAVRKFDGRGFRDLSSAEVGQIAGRAGRYLANGTFGTTREVGELDPALVEAVEKHAFPPLTRLYWRNAALDTRSADRLLASLRRPSPHRALVAARDEDDELALEALALRDLPLDSPEAVETVWEVCRIPDYRKTLTGSHTELLYTIAGHLLASGRLPTDWVAQRIEGLQRPEGDIETLMARIAYVRTWTYVAHQRDWLDDAAGWQERTRAIEDELSDALHERLTRRFVDRRLVLLTTAPDGAVTVDGDVVRVGEHAAGQLVGLHLEVAAGARGLAPALRRGLLGEIERRVTELAEEGDEAFSFDERHRILWRGGAVGWLEAGPGALEPQVRLMRLDLLDAAQKERVRRRLLRFVRDDVEALFRPLERDEVRTLRGAPRGLVHALRTGLGSVRRSEVRAQVDALSRKERQALARLDVRFGAETVYVRSLLRPDALKRRARLWCVARGVDLRAVPTDARASVRAEEDPRFYEAVGYRVVGDLAVRVDVYERVAARLRELARSGDAAPAGEIPSWLGCSRDDLEPVLRGLGYGSRIEAGEVRVRRSDRRDVGRDRGRARR